MSSTPIFVDPFLGAGAVWLRTLGEDLVPPVSWMGGKRRLASQILALLDLRPGCRVASLLGDASWWGWVWPTVLDPETGPRVSEVLRSWRSEDPRALWFRLRDMGPMEGPAEAAAQLLWLQARAASGVPVWWEGGDVVSMDGHGRGPYAAWQATCRPSVDGAGQSRRANGKGVHGGPGRLVQWASTAVDGAGQSRRANGKGVHGGPGRLVQWASTAVDGAGQRQATEPRLLAQSGPRGNGERGACQASMSGDKARLLASDGRGVPRETGHKGRDSSMGGGIVDPGTIAERLDAVRGRLVKATGGEAGFGYDDGVRREKGWRLFEPGDVADRLDTIRGSRADVIVVQASAGDLTDAAAPEIGGRALVYLDPPYQGATGYPVTCAREEVLRIADTWARHGARVVLSEAVGLAAELGHGWSQQRLPSPRKPEWVTTFGCDVRAAMPPLARLWGAA